MPFDGMPEVRASDLAKLRLALDGVKRSWAQGRFGLGSRDHCAIGWLLVATDWDYNETTRLALAYVYPALPERARKEERMESIWCYNDNGSRERVSRLFTDAIKLAERC